MAEPAEQTYATHRRFVPMYHFVAAALFLVNLVYAVIQVFGGFTVGRLIHGLAAIALLILYWYARTFATGVQDRVIRLEERLRLQELLDPDVRARIPELTTRQLVALRFASDGELQGLVRRVFDERIDDPETIKRLIVDWRPDHCRV
jgi:hypothetical protein